jgi:hypothetical protein
MMSRRTPGPRARLVDRRAPRRAGKQSKRYLVTHSRLSPARKLTFVSEFPQQQYLYYCTLLVSISLLIRRWAAVSFLPPLLPRSQSMTITSSFKESLRLGLFFFTGFSSKKTTSSSSISPRSCFTPDTLSSTFTPDSWYFSRSFFTSRASASSFWGLLAPNCTRLHIKLHNRHKCLYSVPGIRKMGLYTLTLRRFSSLRSSVGSKDSVRRSQEKLD